MRSCYPNCNGGCANCGPVTYRRVVRRIKTQRLLDQCTDSTPIERSVNVPISCFPGLEVGDALSCELCSIQFEEVCRRVDNCTNTVVDLAFKLNFQLTTNPTCCSCQPCQAQDPSFYVSIVVPRTVACCCTPASILEACESTVISCLAVVTAVNSTSYSVSFFIVPCFVINSILNEDLVVSGLQPVTCNAGLCPCCQKLNCTAVGNPFGVGSLGVAGRTCVNPNGTVTVNNPCQFTSVSAEETVCKCPGTIIPAEQAAQRGLGPCRANLCNECSC